MPQPKKIGGSRTTFLVREPCKPLLQIEHRSRRHGGNRTPARLAVKVSSPLHVSAFTHGGEGPRVH